MLKRLRNRLHQRSSPTGKDPHEPSQNTSRIRHAMDKYFTPRPQPARPISNTGLDGAAQLSHKTSESQVGPIESPARRTYRKRSLTENELWALHLDRLERHIDDTIMFAERWRTAAEQNIITQSDDLRLRHNERGILPSNLSDEADESERGEIEVRQIHESPGYRRSVRRKPVGYARLQSGRVEEETKGNEGACVEVIVEKHEKG